MILWRNLGNNHVSSLYKQPQLLSLLLCTSCKSGVTFVHGCFHDHGMFCFPAMNVLDGDEVRLSYNGVYAQRDIVQVQ